MKSGNIIKILLLVLLLLVLSCAIWQNYIPVFKIDRLEGSVKKDEEVSLNMATWFSADYQLYIEKYIVLHNALSPFFIRVNNQIDYSLFDRLHISGGILGKDKYLHDNDYVGAYYGTDFIGNDKLRAYVEKMKFVQDTLRKLNKEFIYIQAPGKASFYPEYLPDSMRKTESEMNNYNQLIKLLEEYNINYINFRPYFLSAKDTSKYPLFTQTGIHWSKYATAVVMDSIQNFIEQNMKLDLPELYWDGVEMGYAKYDDADMEKVLNLLFIMSDKKYAYPNFKFEARDNKDVPVVLMIGDSYLGNLYWGHFYESFDLKSQFWFYNASVYSPKFVEKVHRYQLDQIQVIKNSDVIILGCNEPNIRGTSWAFIDDTYDYFKYGRNRKDEYVGYMKKVDSCKAHMTEKDYNKIVKLANLQKVSIDSAKTVYYMWKMQVNDF